MESIPDRTGNGKFDGETFFGCTAKSGITMVVLKRDYSCASQTPAKLEKRDYSSAKKKAGLY